MKIVFDIELMKPGCVLLQASLGGEPELAHRFSTSDWLLFPTPGLKLYEINEEQLNKLVNMVENLRKVRKK